MLAWIGGIFIVGGAAHCWIPQLRSVAGLYLGYRQDLIGSGSHIDGPGAVAYGLAVAGVFGGSLVCSYQLGRVMGPRYCRCLFAVG